MINKQFLKIIPVLILFFPFISIAQIEPIGYYIDNAHQEINGYIDKDYVPSEPFRFNLSYSIYQVGGYTDLAGEFHYGRVKLINKNQKISFTTDDKDVLPIVLKADEIKSFVVAKDSFVVVHNFSTNFINFSAAFMAKYMKVNGIDFYKLSHNENKFDYFFLDKGRVMYIPTNKSSFIEAIEPITIKYDTLHKDIVNGEYKYEDLGIILSSLNNYIHYVKQAPYYYSSEWEVIDSGEKASFYSKMLHLDGYKADITYYDRNDAKLLEIIGQPINTFGKTGTYIWYYPNGNVRRKATFLDDKEVGKSLEYYPSGELHYKYYIKEVGKSLEYYPSGELHPKYYLGVQNEKIYLSVCDSLGEVLFSSDGVEKVVDPFNGNRVITKKYKSGKLVESYYLDSGGEKIYQLAKSNANLRNMPSQDLSNRLSYPKNARDSLIEGMVLSRIIVNPKGKIDSVKVIKGISKSIDEQVVKKILDLNFLFSKPFTSASNGKEKVYQETIIPIIFTFEKEKKEMHFDPLWWNQQQMFRDFNQFNQDMNMQQIQRMAPTFYK